MTEPRRIRLPAARQPEGAATVSGYETAPSEAHLRALSSMLADLSDRLTTTSASHRKAVKRVRLTLTALPLGLPTNFFYFPLTEVDDDGEPRLLGNADEVTAVLIANQPLPLVREVVLRFFIDLIERSGPVQDVAEGRRDLGDLPSMISASEAETGLVAWESLADDWTRAIEVVKARAAANGFTLSVRHTASMFAHRDDLTRRIPALKRLYRQEPRVRRWVDHIVASSSPGELVVRGGHEGIRLKIQQQTALTAIPQMLAQAVRDAYVCGNGFVAPEMVGLDMGARCYRPETTEVLPDGSISTPGPDGAQHKIDGPVMHLRGAEQLDSSYGVSALEPFLNILEERRVIAESRALQAATPAHLQDRFERADAVSGLMEQALEQRILDLTGVIEQLPRQIPPDLYLAGSEDI